MFDFSAFKAEDQITAGQHRLGTFHVPTFQVWRKAGKLECFMPEMLSLFKVTFRYRNIH